MVGFRFTALAMCGARAGIKSAISFAMVEQNFSVMEPSLLAMEKKNWPPRTPSVRHCSATDIATVDLPEPAMSQSQNIGFPDVLSYAQRQIISRIATRVPCRQIRWTEDAANSTTGSWSIAVAST